MKTPMKKVLKKSMVSEMKGRRAKIGPVKIDSIDYVVDTFIRKNKFDEPERKRMSIPTGSCYLNWDRDNGGIIIRTREDVTKAESCIAYSFFGFINGKPTDMTYEVQRRLTVGDKKPFRYRLDCEKYFFGIEATKRQ